MLTSEYVRGILSYDPDTGVLRWKLRTDVRSAWNQKFAGKVAGPVGKGYVKITINDRAFYAHRLAWLIITGQWPLNEIDHKDQNPANNRWDNLRIATRQQNQQNRKRHKSNTSGFKGVFKNQHGVTWSAQIYRFGKKIHVGCFPTAEAAHAAYCVASRDHYGEFARVA